MQNSLINNIFLVGFMGAGKTTIGRLLAVKAGWQFVDLDDEIVQRSGQAIAQIFAEQGEESFRALETTQLQQLGNTVSVVVSTGGGIIGRPENWRLMKQKGCVVYLHASWQTLVARLVDTTQRPLAAQGANETLYALWQKRLPLYQNADVTIETDHLSAEQTADAIMALLLPHSQSELD